MDHDINQLIDRLKAFRDARGWSKFHTPKDLAISISLEASELLEVFQWRPSSSEITEKTHERIADEAADVFLYLLMLCERVGVDLLKAAHVKIDSNEQRFPVSLSYGIAKALKRGDDDQ